MHKTCVCAQVTAAFLPMEYVVCGRERDSCTPTDSGASRVSFGGVEVPR